MHICADTIEKVDKAARLVHPLLTPLDAEHNVHKQRQLRELAEINGTIKDVSKLQEMLIAEEQNATMYKLNDDLQARPGQFTRRRAKFSPLNLRGFCDGGKSESTSTCFYFFKSFNFIFYHHWW